MNIPASQIIQELFLRAGLATDGGQEPQGIWPCYLSSLPPHPDNALCVFDTTGMKDGREMQGRVVMHPAVMVQVRSQGYLAGWSKAEQVVQLIDAVRWSTVPLNFQNYTLTSINRNTGILQLGTESQGTKRRDMFSLNLLMTFVNDS